MHLGHLLKRVVWIIYAFCVAFPLYRRMLSFDIHAVNPDTGICQKCYRSVEKLYKLEKEATDLKGRLIQSVRKIQETVLMQSRTVVSKRMLRSPGVAQDPAKRNVGLLVPINYVEPVKILPFSDISNTCMQPVANPVIKKPVRRSLALPTTSTPAVLSGEVEFFFYSFILLLTRSLAVDKCDK